MDYAKILVILAAANIALSFLKAGLEAIKDKTESDVDNKVYAIVNTLATVGTKLVDIVSANIKH